MSKNPETIEIYGSSTICKLCKFAADRDMEGSTFTEIVERMFAELNVAKAQAVPDTHIALPKVADKKMINAGYEAHDGFFTNGQVQDVYQAMVKASESGAEQP
ncbi:hypothetical protein EA756_11895 [Acinetobacter lactucae]|uniref:Uncharacterized protein n=1 Tax=Acinetobacter lactucae TaxID=1785128 RepID=A0A3R9S254_9GAMM|nr:hypothetical protein [Acinetobacter lactucae]RSO56386.1 hypothetical protein EA756_11895 [Acinetobacter lactucae]